MKTHLRNNIWIEWFESFGDMQEHIGNNIYCLNCKAFQPIMATMGLCGNKTGCCCERMIDMFDISCEDHKIPQILYAGTLAELTETLASTFVDTAEDGAFFNGSYEFKGYKNYAAKGNDWRIEASAKDSLISTSPMAYQYCVISQEK